MEKAEIRIGTSPFKITDQPPRACFLVSTRTCFRGDDERVVWDTAILDGRGNPIKGSNY